MKRNKLNFIILGFTFLLMLTLFFWDKYFTKNSFEKFYNSTIKGKLVEVSYYKGAAIFIVGNQKFDFVPSDINKKADFPYFAKKGDSVYKPAKADTLKLIHNGEVFLYTFKKF